MSDLKALVENYFAPKPKTLTKQMLYEIFDEVMKEELFYQDSQGNLKGPISSVDKISQDIIKYVKRKFPKNYHTADLLKKGGKRVIKFTNFGSLQVRDRVIRDMIKNGFLRDPEIKRSKLFHRATTNFVETTKNKVIPLVVQFDAGGGPVKSGTGYEKEIENILNDYFQANNKSYKAEKQNDTGVTKDPDLIVFENDSPYINFEAKTKLGADFGQFQIQHNGKEFSQKTQIDSPELNRLFGEIKDDLNKSCSINYNPQKSGDLMKIPIEDLGERVEKYYQEKDVDYIVVNDMLYISSDEAKKIPGVKRFKKAASGGFVRVRVKCHGKSYSTTAANKFASIKPSVLYYDVLDSLFP